jgi:hypothetical protein
MDDKPSMKTADDYARIGYEAYRVATGGKYRKGEQLPSWDKLKKDAGMERAKADIVAAWIKSANAVARAAFEECRPT